MENTYQVVESVQNQNIQTAKEQTLSTTTVSVQSTKKEMPKDLNSALYVTGIAMAAIFCFMLIFFLVIKGIDRLFPFKPEEQ